jgi:hypothetical protein
VRWEEQGVFEKVFSDLASSIEKLRCRRGRESSQQQKRPKTLEIIAQDSFFSKDSQEIQICAMEKRVADIVETI